MPEIHRGDYVRERYGDRRIGLVEAIIFSECGIGDTGGPIESADILVRWLDGREGWAGPDDLEVLPAQEVP